MYNSGVLEFEWRNTVHMMRVREEGMLVACPYVPATESSTLSQNSLVCWQDQDGRTQLYKTKGNADDADQFHSGWRSKKYVRKRQQ